MALGGRSQTLRWGQPWLLLPPLTTTCLALAVTAGVRGSILFPMGWFSFSLFQDEDLKIFHSIIGYPISHANQPMLSLWEVGGRPQTWNHTSFALPLKNQEFGGRERRSKALVLGLDAGMRAKGRTWCVGEMGMGGGGLSLAGPIDSLSLE